MADNVNEFLGGEMPEVVRARLPEVMRFRETLSHETDRGSALMGAAYLDIQLGLLFSQAWLDAPDCRGEMLRSSGPLGTFSARIDMAFLCGFIGERAKRDLHLIRRIRNDFAHVPEPLDFSTEHIANRCRELYYTFRDRNDAPRLLFTSVVLGLLAAIHGVARDVKRAKPADDPEITPEGKAAFVDQGDIIIQKMLAMINEEEKKQQ